MLLVIRLGFDKHPYHLIRHVNCFDISAGQHSTCLLQDFISLFFNFCGSFLKVDQSLAAKVGQCISDVLSGHWMNFIFIKKVFKRLRHWILSKHLVNRFMILPYFNFFVSIIEKLRKDVIEQLVHKLHHLTVFSLEETFELIALKWRDKEVPDLSFWKCTILNKKKKNTIIITRKLALTLLLSAW